VDETGGHMSSVERSQYPVDLSCLGDSRDKSRSSTSKLMKRREAKSARGRPRWWSCTEGTDKRRSIPISTFWVSRVLGARVGSFNSRTRE
jgi:hypothetical protein